MILDWVGFIVVGAALISSARAVLGPSAPDRVVAIDAVTSLMIALLVLLGISYGAAIYLDVALAYALLAFIGTLAIAKYLEGRGVET
jgi:multicomponent Na+:H+ antiporter subunit F